MNNFPCATEYLTCLETETPEAAEEYAIETAKDLAWRWDRETDDRYFDGWNYHIPPNAPCRADTVDTWASLAGVVVD